MRKQGVFSAFAAALWIVLGHGIINLAELMGLVAAALLFSLGAATLAELWMVFFGGSSEGPVLLQIVRAAHVGIGAALMAWSFIELIAGSQRSKPRP
jgi:hypothetical protein